MDNNKVLFINSAFTVKDNSPSAKDSIFIEGYASTNDIDRAGDVVPVAVWEKGIKNYLKNPIILAYHDHNDPVGRVVQHKVDSKGLWVKARISSASKIFNLVKDNVLTAFSIGFKVLDASYDSATEIFSIKELELVEISIVSVPCNQNTIFSLAKAFDSAEDYNSFKKQFVPKGESAKGLESTTEADSTTLKEWKMNPEEIKQMLADAAKNAAEEATKSLLAAQAAQAKEQELALKAAAELDQKIKSTVEASIRTVDTGAEKLLAEVTKRFEDQNAESKNALAGLEAAIKEKTAELSKIQASKMQFGDSKDNSGSTYAEREKAYLLGKITGKGIEGTRFGSEIVQKAGQHLPSNTWELEVSLNMENEVRRRLVVAPLIRAIAMKTNVMSIPVNPEAGVASWATKAGTDFGTSASAGGTTATGGAGSPHLLKEITLNSYKVATNEYLNYEEEEDSLIVLLPIIRDAMVRRVSRAIDRAFLNGGGATTDPVLGLARYETTSTVTPTNTGAASIANMRAMRKNLGAWGLDPSEVVYIVSTDVYYDLLDDTTFQTMNQVGVQATLLTGQVGSIGNSPVLVSAEFATKAGGAATAYTNVGAICFAPGNFIIGNQRGLRVDTQELVETQRRVLVASMRTGMTRVTSNLGSGVATLRWS